MPYSEVTIRQDLKLLNIARWDWPPQSARLPVDLATGKQPTLSAQDATEQLAQYCWRAYEKTLGGSGDQVIGRVNHLSSAELFEKVSEIVGKPSSSPQRGCKRFLTGTTNKHPQKNLRSSH